MDKKFLILDGATGTEISRLGGKIDKASWSAIANKTHPEIVRSIHEEYLKAGVDIITTNTFSSCRHVLEGSGFDNETKEINESAVRIVKEACDNVSPSKEILIAGSMSNTLALKNERGYPDPIFIPTRKTEMNNYREMANILAESGVDVFILEMMLDEERSSMLLEVVKGIGLPVWVGMSCSENTLGEIIGFDLSVEREGDIGTSYEELKPSYLKNIFNTLKSFDPDVFGVMHTDIKTSYKVIEFLLSNWSGQVMSYPEIINSDYSKHENKSSISPLEFANVCCDWLKNGVNIVGGCCGTTPDHIRKIIELLD